MNRTTENILLLVFGCLIVIAVIIKMLVKRFPSKKSVEKIIEDCNIALYDKEIEIKRLKYEMSELQRECEAQDCTISILERDIEEYKTRNDNQAKDICEQRKEIDRPTSQNAGKDKTIEEQKEILSYSTQLNPGDLIRLNKIKFQKEREEIEARKAIRVKFSKEFQSAIAEKMDWDYFYQVLGDDALGRAFATDNSILSLTGVCISATMYSEHVDGTEDKPYYVTLTSCECDDYVKRGRKKPCKHMAYLAYALGVLQQDVVANQTVVEQHKKMRRELNEYRRQRRQQKAKSE